MKILHLDLQLAGDQHASFRFFWDNPHDYQSRQLLPAEITDLIERAKTEYYTRLPEDFTKTGQALYIWLDGSDRFFANALSQPHPQGLIIAIATDKGLAHLPWELLHDGECFLVEKTPPIIPVRRVANGRPIATANSPQNRPLNVLFMAASPLGVEPELDYEAEERKILEATARPTITLRVEESGCLTELSYVVREYETGYFDVFHLIGHGTHQGVKPYFLTEDEYGNQVDSSTEAIVEAISDTHNSLPPLIFLSGCRTGYSSDGAVPSMAEELLNKGASAVLSWGERVRDTDATTAASRLYKELSQGGTLAKALSSTYRTLIQQKTRDWHKLRLYVANTLPEALVTPSNTNERKQLPKLSTTLEFRDDERRLRVATRENFVGRRRQLQNCLRTLKTDDDKVGILIHGMGGLGKSTIASRLWDRLSEHKKVLWWRQIDESYLMKEFKDKLIKPEQQELIPYLENSQIQLKSRLSYLFNQLANMGEKPFLLILDDFEWNLEPRAGRYILKPQTAPIIAALVEAIEETGSRNRIIITCRYGFDSDLLEYFYKQGLEPLKGSELTKKLKRLENFQPDKISGDLRERALKLADGNPRLLEFINNEVLGKQDTASKLAELEQNPNLWKDKIIFSALYQLIDEPLQKILSNCLIYEIPVPMTALEAVCNKLPNFKEELQRGIELGLIEVSHEAKEENRVYRVSRIIPHIFPNIRLPEAPEVYSLYQKAHEKLHDLWDNKGNESAERCQEIFRLKFADKKNPERFREAFHNLLEEFFQNQHKLRVCLQPFTFALRKVASDLVDLELCKLENYLKQQQWKEADKETAWIFYQILVKENHSNWEDLMKNFPCDVLRKIDQLWLDNSSNKFGISLQFQIYCSLIPQIYTMIKGLYATTYDDWSKLLVHIGWMAEDCSTIEDLYAQVAQIDSVHSEELLLPPRLPALIYSIFVAGGGQLFGWVVSGVVLHIFIRTKVCAALYELGKA